jgi:transcription-repair coupling factor (superfamily II helicase)
VNEVQKLDIYKRIAGIESMKDRDDMRDELLDRFGAIPRSVDNLLRIALIRVAAHKLYITELKGKNERIIFTLKADAPIIIEKIPGFVKENRDRLSFTAYGQPFFTLKYQKCGVIEADAETLLKDTEEMLGKMEILFAIS